MSTTKKTTIPFPIGAPLDPLQLEGEKQNKEKDPEKERPYHFYLTFLNFESKEIFKQLPICSHEDDKPEFYRSCIDPKIQLALFRHKILFSKAKRIIREKMEKNSEFKMHLYKISKKMPDVTVQLAKFERTHGPIELQEALEVLEIQETEEDPEEEEEGEEEDPEEQKQEPKEDKPGPFGQIPNQVSHISYPGTPNRNKSFSFSLTFLEFDHLPDLNNTPQTNSSIKSYHAESNFFKPSH